MLFILLIAFIIFIGFITALFGRVWCGWACPQTVFIEGVFRRIETWTEGKARERKRMSEGPLTINKVIRKSIKWFLFLVVSLVLSHSFLAYFVQVEEFMKIVQISPKENETLFYFMLGFTGLFMFNFGWFREQFCIIVCPYGRFQSVFMDQDSLGVTYDFNRGGTGNKDGDCVNCLKCVHVCPTGIDIRIGNQMECINCTRCIDACDNIMTKVNKPQGLIRFATEREITTEKSKFIRPRVIIYATVLFVLMVVGSLIISQSKNLDVLFLRGTKTPYQVVVTNNTEIIVNHYKADFLYRGDKKIKINFKVDHSGVEIVVPMKNQVVSAGRKKIIHVFFKFSKSILVDGNKVIKVDILNDQEKLLTKTINLVGPYD